MDEWVLPMTKADVDLQPKFRKKSTQDMENTLLIDGGEDAS